MKTLNLFFFSLILSISISSCTPQALDNQTDIIENPQSTGGDDTTVNNGGKG